MSVVTLNVPIGGAQPAARKWDVASNATPFRSALSPILFWSIITFVTVVATAVGVSTHYLIVAAMIVVVVRNMGADPSGMENLLFIIATTFLGAFPIRYQIGYSLANSTSLYNTVFFLVLLLVLTLEWMRRDNRKLPSAVKLVLVYIGIAILSAVITSVPFSTVRRVLFSVSVNYLLFVYAFLVARRNEVSGALTQILYVVMLGGILDCSYGVYQSIAGSPSFELNAFAAMGLEEYIFFGEDYIKIVGLSGSAYSLFYTLGFNTVVVLPFARGEIKQLRLITLALIATATLVLLSFSERTGVVMAAFTLVVAIVVHLSEVQWKRAITVLVASIVLLTFALPILSEFVEETFTEQSKKIQRMSELSSPAESSTMLWRYTKWEEGFSKLGNSFLFGDGYKGEYGYHMEYLNVYLTFGMGGLVVWLLFQGSILRLFWRVAARKSNTKMIRNFAIGLFAFYCSNFFVAAVPNNPFTYASGMILFIFSAVFFAHQEFLFGEASDSSEVGEQKPNANSQTMSATGEQH